MQQSEALLRHDKDYLSRQVSELTQKVTLAEDKLEGVAGELASVKQAKERLYQDLLTSR